MRILLATLSAILCLTSPVLGANWQVAADGSGDAPTISAALDTYAAAGDSIELTGGIYSGTGNVSLEILLADITLWSTAAEAVIDCGGTVNGITVWADGFRAEGFRITDGQAIDGGGVLINDGSSQFIDITIDACNATRGGGFYQASAGTLLLDNCVIRDCNTTLGGGIYLEDNTGVATFIHCIIESNSATGSGGGIHAADVAPHFMDCEFKLNTAENSGGDCFFDYECAALFERCAFSESQAQFGSSIHAGDVDQGRFEYCTFSKSGGVYYYNRGGALHAINEATPSFLNCTFFRCMGSEGSAIFCDSDAAPTLENCIIAYGRNGDAFQYTGAHDIQFTCCDIYGNSGGDWTGDIAGQMGVNGNISEDPQLIDPWNGNFNIATASPCGPYVNPGCGRIGAGLSVPLAPTYVLFANGQGMLWKIQDAIDLAPSGSTVLLDAGTYTGPRNRDLDFLGKELHLGALDPGGNRPVIDAQGSAPDPHRGIWLRGGEPAGTSIRNLIIRNGYTDTSSSMSYPGSGGGLLVTNSSKVILESVWFEENIADLVGSDVCAMGGGADVTLNQCSMGDWSDSSAIYANSCGLTLLQTGGSLTTGIFLQLEGLVQGVTVGYANISSQFDVAISISNTFGNLVTIDNCIIRGGIGDYGLLINGSTNVDIVDCTLNAFGETPGYNSIGVFDAEATFTDCSFDATTTDVDCKAAQLENSQVSFEQCTFRNFDGNSAQGTVVSIGGSIDLDGCSFTSNEVGVYHSGPGSLGATVNNCYFSGQQLLCIEIESSNAPVRILDSEIRNSFAGVQLAQTPDCAIQDCTFTENPAFRTLTLIGATGNVTGCGFHGNSSNDIGGAISIFGSSITVDTCVFNGNSSLLGGGAIGCDYGLVSVIDCGFQSNDSEGAGGAAFSSNADIQYVNSQFIDNESLAHGGAVYGTQNAVYVFDCGFNYNNAVQGGAVHYEFGTFYAEGSNFTENSATYGGAISGYQSEMSVLTSEIVGNDATQHGGIYLNQCDPSIVNICLLANNTASSRGSGLTAFACDPTISTSTIVGNGGVGSHAQVFFEGVCAPTMVLALIAYGTDGPAVDTTTPESFAPFVNCSDVFGNAGGDWVGPLVGLDSVNNNFSEDPLFCDMPGGDYTLHDNSPCYYPNNACNNTVGVYGQGCESGPTSVPAMLPTAVALLPNHPNPFNPSTEIRFELPEAANVDLIIYDGAGRRLRTLLTEAAYEAGVHGVVWNGKDDTGQSLPSGIYFTRFEAGGESHGSKLTLIK